MKFRMFFLIGILALAGVGVFVLVQAQEPDDGRKIVPSHEVIDGDYTAAGETVEISGVVKGDVYVVGGQILVSGVVEGDLIALGGVVSISGIVEQNVRVGGWQVIVSGNVQRNTTIGAMNIEVTPSAKLGGGFVAGGANTVLGGTVAKEAKVAGRNLTVTSAVKGNMEAAVENIRLVPGARVGGDFTYWSNRDASIGENVVIQGTISKKAAQGLIAQTKQLLGPVGRMIDPFLGVASFVASLLVGVFLIGLFPDYSRQTVLTLRNRKWQSLTNGITTLLIVPVIFGILIITIVGIPLGIVLLLLSSFLLYVARIFVMLWAGIVLAETFHIKISDSWAFVIGLILYTALVQLPYIGWFISFAVVLFGLGAAFHTLKEKYLPARRQESM